MLPLSPALFIAAASALVASDEVAPLRVGRAEFDPLLRDQHGPSDAKATAAFIAHVGYWSHRRTRGSSIWPFPLDADCDELARLAACRDVLSGRAPEPGAIALRWSLVEQRFTRASIVLRATDVPPANGDGWAYDCLVLEGSAALSRIEKHGNRPGTTSFVTRVHWARRARIRCCPALGDRLISWVDLDGRNVSSLLLLRVS